MKLSRRECLTLFGKAGALLPLGLVLGNSYCGGSHRSQTPAAQPTSSQTFTDEQLLDDIQRAAFEFFWNECSPQTGQVKDRALANGGDTRTVSSVAATGFGLTALCIGHSRGYCTQAEIHDRVAATLQFLLNNAPTEQGFFYHYFDMNTGARAFTSEVSSIDTSIALCGALTARAHFADAGVKSLATQLYERVNWPWILNGGTTFSMGWKPESGFIRTRWDTYSEMMMLYLLAIGSPTHPVSADTWSAWSRPKMSYQGFEYITTTAPLFIHQYSHAWFDFRSKSDAFANYFDNSIAATKAHKAFCLAIRPQFSDYSDALWGITASDSVKGYVAWGGPPPMGPLDGSIVPAATAGSLPFLPNDCLRVLHTIREQYGNLAWKKYGFVDALNPLTNWADADVIGIDLGISMLMIENYRSGLVWNTFMKNAEAGNALAKVGFHAV
jgi:hypothetical protein